MNGHECFVIFFVLIFSFSETIYAENIGENPIVQAKDGQIKGNILTSRLGEKFIAFRGIRYAEAPVGSLRFKPPRPAKTWTDVFEATEDGPMCPQPTANETDVSEDCLRLNVYSRVLKPKELKPVLVYLHPGGFYILSSQSKNIAGPEYLMERDVVLVTLNYRLGTLGFLATGTPEAPGNNGLKDQVMALRWIRDNIEHFGGDPNSVTIMGYSAGGVSVSLHMISPMSRGLFHRAIVMSAAATAQWNLGTDQMFLAKRQAKLLGCSDDTAQEMIECFNRFNGTAIANTLKDMFDLPGGYPVLLYMPVVEPDFGQERFLTDDPNILYRDGHFARVPVMAGVTKYEFLYPAIDIVKSQKLRDQINSNFTDVAPLYFQYETDTERSRLISLELKNNFLREAVKDGQSLIPLNHLFADGIIGYGVHRFVKLASAHTTLFYYQNSYVGRYSHTYYPGDKPYGTVHHDDLLVLFNVPVMEPIIGVSDPESSQIERVTRIWTNFAKTGNPNNQTDSHLRDLKWTPTSPNRMNYLDIGNELVSHDDGLNVDRYNVWDRLFPIEPRSNPKNRF